MGQREKRNPRGIRGFFSIYFGKSQTSVFSSTSAIKSEVAPPESLFGKIGSFKVYFSHIGNLFTTHAFIKLTIMLVTNLCLFFRDFN
jgi:hypothetical protein